MKAIRSNDNVSPHGGAVPILKKMRDCGIPQAIRSILGNRKKQSKYGYEDIFIAWVLTSMCGGTRLDHISKLKKKLSIIPDLKIPSHDTLGRVMKQLATKSLTAMTIPNTKKQPIVESEYNDNLLLNEMLIKATKRIGALNTNKKYTLHIDATFIQTNCADSKYSYINEFGFFPMVCCIDDTPVFISMRNGNVSAKFQLTRCAKQCIQLLAKYGIKVKKVISDAAAYNKEFVDVMQSIDMKFCTRPMMSTGLLRNTEECTNWRKTEIKTSNLFWQCDIGEVPFKIPHSKTQTRLIMLRFQNKNLKKKTRDERVAFDMMEDKMNDMGDNYLLKSKKRKQPTIAMGRRYDGYEFKFLITNDFDLSPEEIFLQYNKRGDFEKKFDYMKNDFGWKLPPFMHMSPNGVFMIAAALANNIFRGVLAQFTPEIPQLRVTMRLKQFHFVFVHVACLLFEDTYTFYNTDVAYERLL